MNSDLSFVSLILDASLVVKAVMLLLLLASIASWAVIIEKWRLFKQVTGAADAFEATFWSGGDVSKMYREIAQDEQPQLGMAGIFESGYQEFGRAQTARRDRRRTDRRRFETLHARIAGA